MRVLVTGAAGFIGFHLAKRLLAEGHEVVGLDNLNSYYDVKLKKDRLDMLLHIPANTDVFTFCEEDLANAKGLHAIFLDNQFTHVVNLAAQAGVRYSLDHPSEYIQANLTGFANLLEECRHAQIAHLVYASSSSVYGLNANLPYSPRQNVDHPESLYAATKKSNELLAHAYAHLWGLPATGLRFFTVYGPWGRPDMAMYLFTRAILHDQPINLFNQGNLQRDFTYIDDIIEGVMSILDKPAQANPLFDPIAPDPASSSAPWRIYNIGNNQTVQLTEFVRLIENEVGKKAVINYLPMQPGDVQSTWADISDLAAKTGFAPATPLAEGIHKYVQWHRYYYG